MLKELSVIALGGAAGSVTRFIISQKIHGVIGEVFPLGILLVNVSGCFVIGLLGTLLLTRMEVNSLLSLAILIGFLGGYTTFSSFSFETLTLIQMDEYIKAFAYIFSSVFLSLLATGLGIVLAKLC